MIVLDIDEFKRINDTYGHHVGDQALREVATSLQGALRPYDMCVRFAGDEFIVVISDCGRESRGEQAARAAGAHQRDRNRGRGSPGKRIRLGASAGAAVFPHDGTTTRSCSPRPTTGCIATRQCAAAAWTDSAAG